MKSASKVALVLGISLTSHLLYGAEESEADVFNLDCTASYTKNGQTETVRPHGSVQVGGNGGGVGLRNELAPSDYVADVIINIRPEGDVSHWVASFANKDSENLLKQRRENLILDGVNQIELDYSPTTSEFLRISCVFEKQTTPVSVENSFTGELNFDHFAVIRELNGPSDNAAIFGVLPNHSGLEITKITGPAFLGGARVGTLDTETMSRLFTRTSVPMSEAEKQALVEKYKDAKVVYFEGYKGKLCAGPSQIYSVIIDGKIDDQVTSSNFTFAALPTHNGNCRFATLSETTSFHN